MFYILKSYSNRIKLINKRSNRGYRNGLSVGFPTKICLPNKFYSVQKHHNRFVQKIANKNGNLLTSGAEDKMEVLNVVKLSIAAIKIDFRVKR